MGNLPANVCTAWGRGCGRLPRRPDPIEDDLRTYNPPGVQEKTCQLFLGSVIHRRFPHRATACLWKTSAGRRRPKSSSRTDHADSPASSPSRTPRTGTRKRLRTPARIRYHPHVCSIKGDAIERIAAAIDQVAREVRGSAEPELTARIAEIWLMMGALDPELARRQQGYTAPADGTPR